MKRGTMKNVTKILAVAATAGLLASLAACSNPDETPSQEASDEPFRVVAIVPESGPLAAPVAMQLAGLELGLEEVNADGGVGGREIELSVLDSKLDPTQAVSLLQEQINSDTPPDYVWAGATSGEALAMLPLLSSSKILSGSTASSTKVNDPAQYPYHFGMQTSNDQNYIPLLDHIEEEGYEKVAYIHSNDALGTDSLDNFMRRSAERDLEVVTQAYDPTATDLVAPMDALMATDPDVLVMNAYGAPVGYLFDARQKLAWDVPVIGDQAVGASNPAAVVPAEALEDVLIDVSHVAALSRADTWQPNTAEAVDAIAAKTEIVSLINQALEPYDAMHILALAAEQSGSTDPDAMKEALEELEVPSEAPWTVYAEYGWTAESHFPTLREGDTVLVAPSVMVNGQYE